MIATTAKPALADRLPKLNPLTTAAADYDVVRRAIAHIRRQWRDQPEIEAIADAAGVTATELHHLFRRWCGLTPKAFLQALTLDSAREPAAQFGERAGYLLRGRPVRAGPLARSVRHA